MDGEVITQRERRDVVLLVGEPALTVTFSRYAPGERGPDLHVHREHIDAFYVLEGELPELKVRVDESGVTLEAGDVSYTHP
jgi:uncharacterized cupin superfamily protein